MDYISEMTKWQHFFFQIDEFADDDCGDDSEAAGKYIGNRFASNTETMVVKFKSNDKIAKKGFRAKYTSAQLDTGKS